MNRITLEDTIGRTETQVSCSLEDTIVIMSTDTGEFYDLNDSASTVWQMLEQPRRVSDICDELTRRYRVTRERCMSEVIALLERLREKRVVHVL